MDKDSIRGLYELHHTIDLDNPTPDEFQRFSKICEAEKLKPIHVGILYSTGWKRLMQTSKYVPGTMSDATTELARIDKLLKDYNYQMIRKKIEMMAQSMSQKYETLPEDKYYETHIVVKIDEGYWDGDKFQKTKDIEMMEKLNEECMKNILHRKLTVPLSFNLKKKNECFITVRSYGVKKVEAEKWEEHCKDLIKQKGYEIIKSIREGVELDDNWKIDSERL